MDLPQAHPARLEEILERLLPGLAWPARLSVTGLAHLCAKNPSRDSRLEALQQLITYLSTPEPTPVMSDTHQVDQLLAGELAFSAVERVFVVPLDGQGRPIHAHELSQGTLESCSVPLRALVHHLLDVGASRFILVHNHPSGDATPSDQDRRITERLRARCAPLDLTLVDHVVIARNGYGSARFSEAVTPRAWLRFAG